MKQKNLFDIPLQSVNYSIYQDGKEITQAKIYSDILYCKQRIKELKARQRDGKNVHNNLSVMEKLLARLEKRRAKWDSL